jgi:hypothetical protein
MKSMPSKSTPSIKRLSLSEWFKTITFYEILVGMKATLSHLLNYRPVTLQYPHEAHAPGQLSRHARPAALRRRNREMRGVRSL